MSFFFLSFLLHTSEGNGTLHGTAGIYLEKTFICIIEKQGLERGIATAKSQSQGDQHVQQGSGGLTTILYSSQVKGNYRKAFTEGVWIKEIGISLVLARTIQQQIVDLIFLSQVQDGFGQQHLIGGIFHCKGIVGSKIEGILAKMSLVAFIFHQDHPKQLRGSTSEEIIDVDLHLASW